MTKVQLTSCVFGGRTRDVLVFPDVEPGSWEELRAEMLVRLMHLPADRHSGHSRLNWASLSPGDLATECGRGYVKQWVPLPWLAGEAPTHVLLDRLRERVGFLPADRNVLTFLLGDVPPAARRTFGFGVHLLVDRATNIITLNGRAELFKDSIGFDMFALAEQHRGAALAPALVREAIWGPKGVKCKDADVVGLIKTHRSLFIREARSKGGDFERLGDWYTAG